MNVRARARTAIDYTLFLGAILGVVASVVLYPGAFGADAHAVYLPVVRGLLEGYGLHAFAALVQGALRLPGYPAVLAACTAPFGDLRLGVQASNAAAMVALVAGVFFAVKRTGASEPWPGLAAVAVALERNVLDAGGRGMPDAVGLGLIALFFVAMLSSDRALGWRALLFCSAAGLLTALALQVRLNLIALCPAGLLFILVRHRPWFFARALVFCFFCFGPLIVVVPISHALLELGLDYPSGTVAAGVAAGQKGLTGDTALARMLAAALLGLEDQPSRFWGTVGGPWCILGVVALFTGVIRRPRDPVRMLAVCSFVMLSLALVPIHFEARYYVFAAPFLVGASFAAIAGLLQGPWVRVLGPVAGLLCVGWIVRELPARWRGLEHRRASETLVQRACEHLESDIGEGKAAFVVTTERLRMYSRFNDCETRVGVRPKVFLSGEVQGIHTASHRLTVAGAKRPYEVDDPDRRAQFGPYIFERIEPALDPADIAVLGKPLPPAEHVISWTITTPNRSSQPCRSERLKLSPGRYALRVRIKTEGMAAARVLLGLGTRFQSFFGAGEMSHERIVTIPGSPRSVLRLCPVSAYRPGRIEVEARFHPIGEGPTEAGPTSP